MARHVPTCLVINAQSLMSTRNNNGKQVSNISRFQELVYTENSDIVFVTETWLKEHVDNIELLPKGYNIFRQDRKTRGGGVLIAIKSSSFDSSRIVTESSSSNLEIVIVEIITKSKLKLLACCCYRPPDSGNDWSDEFNVLLANCVSHYANILICGDFNLPKVNWISPERTSGSHEAAFVNQLDDYFLTQLNTTPTRAENVLDLVITSLPDNIKNISVISPAQSGLLTDHSSIVFNFGVPKKATPKPTRTVFDYKRGDFDALLSALQNIDFDKTLRHDDINTSWLEWKHTFLNTVNTYIPSKRVKGRNSPPWMNGDIMHELRKKDTIRDKLKKSPDNDALRSQFKDHRSKVKKMIRESRENFFNSLDADLSENPKRFWSVFKLKSKESCLPATMYVGRENVGNNNIPEGQASTPASIATMFNQYFSSVFNPTAHGEPLPGEHGSDQPLATPNFVHLLSEVKFEVREVHEALKALDVSKATGPDNIPCRLLKGTAQQIAPSLTKLFNLSLRLGTVPDEWKLANVIPVFKRKGDKQSVENYRPISLLCVISKILERCVLTNLRDHLLELINNAQHGFQPGKSCTTQLLEVLHCISSLLDKGKQTDVIYMDMSKAFDKVDHVALLHKLEHNFDISGILLHWLKSYLTNRRQRVTVLGCSSNESPVTSGVPQGSILGPILFLLYVNDLPDSVQHSNVACFADDTKIFRSVDSIDSSSLVQQDLHRLEDWSRRSGLVFNETKCKSQRITRKTAPTETQYILNEKPLLLTSQEKDLGVWISSDLTWSKQVSERCAKANKLLGFLRRTAMEISKLRTRRTLYLTVVRSALGYATQVWSPQTVKLIQQVERIQRRATKFILGLPFLCAESYKERLISTGLLPLCYWHEYLDLIFFFKATTGLVSVSPDVLPTRSVPTRTTRSSANTKAITYRPDRCRTATHQRSFFLRTSRLWNILPEHLRYTNVTLRSFRSSLLGYYRNALLQCYDADDPRSYKSICIKCNNPRLLLGELSCCF